MIQYWCIVNAYILCILNVFEKKNMIRFSLFRESALVAARTMGFRGKILERRNQRVAISGSAIGDDQRDRHRRETGQHFYDGLALRKTTGSMRAEVMSISVTCHSRGSHVVGNNRFHMYRETKV